MGLRLNLGSGDEKLEGYINVDKSFSCKADFNWDITCLPFPNFNPPEGAPSGDGQWHNIKYQQLRFPENDQPDNSVDEIKMDNLAEHIEAHTLIRVINECHRILKPGGKLWIRVPQVKFTAESLNAAFTDPTHCNYFTLGTFQYWDKNHKRHKAFGKDYVIIPWSRVEVKEWEERTIFLICEMTK